MSINEKSIEKDFPSHIDKVSGVQAMSKKEILEYILRHNCCITNTCSKCALYTPMNAIKDEKPIGINMCILNLKNLQILIL